MNLKELEDLIKDVYNNQYKEVENDMEQYIQTEIDAKERMEKSLNQTQTDASNLKNSEILNALKNNQYITINNFHIKIYKNKDLNLKSKYGDLFKNAVGNKIYMIIYERVNKSATGAPCNILVKVKPKEDDRFKDCEWSSLFTWEGKSNNITIEKATEITKYLKTYSKMPLFF